MARCWDENVNKDRLLLAVNRGMTSPDKPNFAMSRAVLYLFLADTVTLLHYI